MKTNDKINQGYTLVLEGEIERVEEISANEHRPEIRRIQLEESFETINTLFLYARNRNVNLKEFSKRYGPLQNKYSAEKNETSK